jgi:hypothetical protein
LAAAEFDVFLTADRNLSYQQDVSAFDIAVIVLLTKDEAPRAQRKELNTPQCGLPQ